MIASTVRSDWKISFGCYIPRSPQKINTPATGKKGASRAIAGCRRTTGFSSYDAFSSGASSVCVSPSCDAFFFFRWAYPLLSAIVEQHAA
jgi:hypothetical protein